MQSEAPERTKNAQIRFGLWWAGLIAIVLATALNVLIGYLAIRLLDIPKTFAPLDGYGTIIPFTVIGVGAATVVYALLLRYSRNPKRVFVRVAGAALLLTLVPDILLLVASAPGATAVSVGVLTSMHVAAWAISVGTLI